MTDEQFSVLLAAMQRIEALIQPAHAADALLIALGYVYERGIPFLAADALAASEALREAAANKGDRLPDLPRELDRAGIADAAGLGKYLGARKGQGVQEVGRVGEGMLWQLM